MENDKSLNLAELNLAEIELQECPLCGGAGILEEEEGWCFYVSCMECGSHTAEAAYKTEEEKKTAAGKAAHIWNIGKVVRLDPGE